jgi:MFS transporter, ACS family, DAL5 transporter family protein
MSADHMHRRTPFILWYLSLVIVGFVLIGWGPNTGTKLTGIFFGVAGLNCVTPTVLTFLANNVAGTGKRTLAIPLQSTLGRFGGIARPLMFRSQDAPHYSLGFMELSSA